MSTRLKNEHREDAINKLVKETFSERQADLVAAEAEAFKHVMSYLTDDNARLYIDALPSDLAKAFISRTDNVMVNIFPALKKLYDSKAAFPLPKRIMDKVAALKAAPKSYMYKAVYRSEKHGRPTTYPEDLPAHNSDSNTLNLENSTMVCPVAISRGQTHYVDDYKDPLFTTMIDYLYIVHKFHSDRHKLITELMSLMAGFNTSKQVYEYDPELAKYLPESERVAKPMIMSPDNLHGLIKCCKEGTKKC